MMKKLTTMATALYNVPIVVDTSDIKSFNLDTLFFCICHILILSRLVDTFSLRILYPMLLLSGNHSIAVV